MQLNTIWKKLQGEGLALGPEPVQGTLSSVSQVYHCGESLRTLLSEFNGSGWVMFTDAVVDLKPNVTLREGVMLAAEVVAGNESLHIRQAGASWMTWRISRSDEAGQLIFREAFQRIPRGKMVYEVAWEKDSEGVYRPKACRLAEVAFQ